MFHKATELNFKEGTLLELTFQDGKVKEHDMASLFDKYPQLRALEDRQLFLSGKLLGAYGIMWNDESLGIDWTFDAETIPNLSKKDMEHPAFCHDKAYFDINGKWIGY